MLRRLATLLVVLSLVACSDSTGPIAAPTPMLAASISVDRVTTDLTGLVVVNDCTGETITVDGRLVTRMQTVVSSSGGTKVSVHQTAKASGTSDLGFSYNLILVTHATIIDAASSDASVLAVPFTIKFVGQGPGENYHLKSLVHITTNAAGEVTSYIDRTEIGCL